MRGPITDSKLEVFRRETRGCAHVVHFDHAGSSLMPDIVVETVLAHTRREAEIGGYEAFEEAKERVQNVYESVAALIGAKASEIALVENATRGWDMAFYAIEFSPGDRILTSISEYASNVIAYLQIAERGVSVEVVPNDEQGQLSISELERMLDSRVRLVSVSHMPTNGGLVQPVEHIGRLARQNGSLFLLDACQTTGQLPIDVSDIQCDFLSATSRKYLRGPRGAGFLYVREDLIESMTPPFLDLHAATWNSEDSFEIRKDAGRFENWEKNYANHLGMGAAIDYAIEIGLDHIWERIQRQAGNLRQQLAIVPGVTIQDTGAVRGGIVSFEVEGVPARTVVTELRNRKINTTTSTVASTRFDMKARGLTSLVRSSVHYFTTDEECSLLARAIAEISASAPMLAGS